MLIMSRWLSQSRSPYLQAFVLKQKEQLYSTKAADLQQRHVVDKSSMITPINAPVFYVFLPYFSVRAFIFLFIYQLYLLT